MEGFGVNINPQNADFSDITPALDSLRNQLRSTIFAVDIFGNTTWIPSQANLNPSSYATIYESQRFQDTWRVLNYLYAQGVTVKLDATGLVSSWLSTSGDGGTIDPAQESDFVEVLASFVDYGRRVKGLPIKLLSPINEPDLGSPEGPAVGATSHWRRISSVRSALAGTECAAA